MSTKIKRIGTLVIVGLFLISTFGFTGLVIWQMAKGEDNLNNTQEQQVNENALQGKPLENYEPIEKVTKLKIIDVQPGNGAEVKVGDNITANYTGALASTGIVFESSLDVSQPATFGLDQVIKGWQQGVPGMKEGGKRRLIIPAELAYGEQASATIPANSPLVFDIELIKVNK